MGYTGIGKEKIINLLSMQHKPNFVHMYSGVAILDMQKL